MKDPRLHFMNTVKTFTVQGLIIIFIRLLKQVLGAARLT